jgi:hypothetical protein
MSSPADTAGRLVAGAKNLSPALPLWEQIVGNDEDDTEHLDDI